jgi:tripartite-type tricarboxylate transporter receptor subunit TctC
MKIALALLIGLFSAAASAQYPAKPVRLVVGYAPGSSTDIIGRIMADRLSAHWKQSVYVDTRAGAAGNLAADAVAKAAGDGYTLLFAQNGLAISAAALPNLPFKAESDLVPLAPATATPHILIVAPDYPAKDVQQLIAKARAEPGKLSFASSGVGNSDHLCAELFDAMAGIQAAHIPYKGGAPASIDVMAGRVAYYFAGMPVGLPLHKSGRARALAVTSKQRFTGAPDSDRGRAGIAGLRTHAMAGLFRPRLHSRGTGRENCGGRAGSAGPACDPREAAGRGGRAVRGQPGKLQALLPRRRAEMARSDQENAAQARLAQPS